MSPIIGQWCLLELVPIKYPINPKTTAINVIGNQFSLSGFIIYVLVNARQIYIFYLFFLKSMKLKWLIYLFFICFFNIVLSQVSEVIEFESANPFSMSDVINRLEDQEKIKVFGKLTLPSKYNIEKLPLIIGVAGSLGWREHHYDYLKMFQDEGYATFELNSFKSRNITSTVGSQVEVTASAMILDCLLYTSPSPRDRTRSRMPSSA